MVNIERRIGEAAAVVVLPFVWAWMLGQWAWRKWKGRAGAGTRSGR